MFGQMNQHYDAEAHREAVANKKREAERAAEASRECFKPGDVVKCVDATGSGAPPWLAAGMLYVVAKTSPWSPSSPSRTYVWVEGMPYHPLHPNRFVLVRRAGDGLSTPPGYADWVPGPKDYREFGSRSGYKPKPEKDNVNLPEHYAHFKIEPVRFCMENRMDPFQFNVIKYICRHDSKNGIEDIDKVIRYATMYKRFLLGDEGWWKADPELAKEIVSK